jgi:hypothetical protein
MAVIKTPQLDPKVHPTVRNGMDQIVKHMNALMQRIAKLEATVTPPPPSP